MNKLQIAKLGLIATAALSAIASGINPAAAIPYNSATVGITVPNRVNCTLRLKPLFYIASNPFQPPIVNNIFR
ncbi:MAG: hypothetical protein RM368_28830 [Nostoc sp. DedSLP03]|uniref:hypothetical protein n=1 Tax=Nostoc sp. DedSLP03 TaxID=3075400 RepID=UPI002AD4B505|nr:hypothetical protein [Nostoc sp. DedSLP03]MDZ7968910.1 hypothetical protein [Nostoc sp. DedSLP03]